MVKPRGGNQGKQEKEGNLGRLESRQSLKTCLTQAVEMTNSEN